MLREITRAIEALKQVPREYISLVLAEVGGGKKRRGPKPGKRKGKKPGPKPGSKKKPGPKPKAKSEKAPVKVSSEKLAKLARLKAKTPVAESE